jgi:hypothetical protein
VVYGHHIQIHQDGTEELCRAAEFETTWSRLRRGDLWLDWLAGIPGQPAIAIRRDLLARSRFDTRYRIAAGLDLLFRVRSLGARFFNCDEIVAIRAAVDPSAHRVALRRQEWVEVAGSYGDAAAVDQFCALLDAAGGAPPPSTLVDRHAPALARGAERLFRGAAARFLVRRLLDRAPVTPADSDSL